MWKLLCITLAAGFFGAMGWTVAEGTEPTDTLVSIWEGQRSEIINAHIKCRMVRVGKDHLVPLSRRQVHEALAKTDPKDPARIFRTLLERTLKAPSKSERPGTAVEYYYEGTRYKELLSSGACHVFNGELEAIFDNANGHAMVYNPGGSGQGVRYLRDFRMIPDPKAKKDFIGRTGDRVELKAGRNPLIVDGTTGVVYRYSHLDNKGQVSEETIQDCYVTYPGGIVFPSLSVDAMYDGNGTLALLTAAWVDAAEFNRDLPKDAFTFPVPGNIVVFDKRLPDRLQSYRTRTVSPDLFEVVKQVFDARGAPGLGSPGTETPGSSRQGMWWSLGLGGSLVLLSLTGSRPRSEVLWAGIAFLGVVTMALGVALADSPGGDGRMDAIGDQCCNPVHAATPTAPAGSGSVCSYDSERQKCMSSDPSKCGLSRAWQNIIPAAYQAQTGATCNPDAATTNVTITNGNWACFNPPNTTDCNCKWFPFLEDGTQGETDTRTNLSTCTGTTCRASS